jgi:sulfite reductase alpha subunit-like flavoprotein
MTTIINPLLPRSALIAYGSETGNGQDIAEELAQLAERIHFITQLSSLDEVEPVGFLCSFCAVFINDSIFFFGPSRARNDTKKFLKSTLSNYSTVLISVSTTGQGDLPTNARRLWKILLRKKLPAAYLKGVRFAVFGLGDSSYPKYVISHYDL